MKRLKRLLYNLEPTYLFESQQKCNDIGIKKITYAPWIFLTYKYDLFKKNYFITKKDIVFHVILAN